MRRDNIFNCFPRSMSPFDRLLPYKFIKIRECINEVRDETVNKRKSNTGDVCGKSENISENLTPAILDSLFNYASLGVPKRAMW